MLSLRPCILSLGSGAVLALSVAATDAQPPQKPPPTHADVSYGPHERNVLDLWLAESEAPAPLVLFIHGGGFRGGSKSNLEAQALERLLSAGISVAAIEYRFVQQQRLPAAHHDCRRALQFLRSRAEEWNIDETRVGAFGGSAGAQLCMWLAFHDEMADPESDDSVEHESTRLTCVATNGGQTSMDFSWWMEWIPGYDALHRELSETFDAETEEEIQKIAEDISALSLISEDDPPIHMQYGMSPDDPVPTDPQQARGWKVHHVIFGVKLKEKMDELGVEANLKYPGANTPYASREAFLIAKLTEGSE